MRVERVEGGKTDVHARVEGERTDQIRKNFLIGILLIERREHGLEALAGGALGTRWAGAPETLTIPATFAALLLLLALTSGHRHNPLETRVLHYLGEISYATYLGHFLLFVVFKLAFVDDAHAIPPVLIALYLALVLGTSVALYHLVERPAQDGMNRLPTRWRRADPKAQASANSS